MSGERQSPTVVIVGAGPAGAAAAHETASRGLRTIVLERASMPREKVCGEGCTPRAVHNLERMGLLDDLQPKGASVHRAFLVSPCGIELLADLPPSVYGGRALVVPRSTLDARLVERAVRSGAQLREGVRVESVAPSPRGIRVICRGHEPIDADVLIGCDGMPSIVRRSLGARAFKPSQQAFAVRGIFDNVSLPYADALTIVWERDVLPAYGWVFPLPGGRANVGIGLRTDHLREQEASLRAVFQRFLGTPRLQRMLANAAIDGKAKGHPLPMTSRTGPVVFERAILAGDAAGFVNPLTGEGIEYALESGELAGQIAARAAEHGDFGLASLLPYARVCKDRFGAVLRLNGWLRWVFSVPWLLDRIFRAGQRSDAVRDDVAAIALGGEHARLTWRLASAALLG